MRPVTENGAVVWVWAAAVLFVPVLDARADYYDDFADSEWDGNPDPNVWDVDNPHWEFLNLGGSIGDHSIVGDFKEVIPTMIKAIKAKA